MGYQLFKLAAAAWISFVLVYVPLVLFTQTFTLLPNSWPELALVGALTLMGGMGPYGPDGEREAARRAERGHIAELVQAHALSDKVIGANGNVSPEEIREWQAAKDEFQAAASAADAA